MSSTPTTPTPSETTPVMTREMLVSYNKFGLSPIQLVKHVAVYGPRDRTFHGLKCPGTHYRTINGPIINFFLKQGVSHTNVDDSLVLKFENSKDRYNCTWVENTGQVEVMRVKDDEEAINIILD